MNLPLQPSLSPWPPWLKRTLLLGALVIAILALGLLTQARRRPPELALTGPEHVADYARRVEGLIAGARRRIWIGMFVIRAGDDSPPQALLRALAGAAERGVDVRIALDVGREFATGEPSTKHEDAAAWLSANGVRVVLDEPDRTTHLKALVIDSRWVVVGSHNWTYPALTANREASIILDDGGLAMELERFLGGIPGWR